jgi:hypothetical protein
MIADTFKPACRKIRLNDTESPAITFRLTADAKVAKELGARFPRNR